ncbi:MAG: phosphoribosylformylglycinamidine synthase I [Candidatus Levybacteria bacterium RIFCSPLOWO2_02_FULL_36_8b]|nr:MAG: phosphoribosylformylglycinamidine synthase I [Candidatus Levybacteria bacterium RIFCSPLOWO2_02_FULL_36_8b]
MNKPRILVLKTDGINCDEETAFAFNLAGGNVKIVHVNDLRNKKDNLNNYQILAIPGGFSYGDDVVSGKILAIELASFFSENLKKFITRNDTLIIGICNGFQVLIRTGLLPFGNLGKMDATLTNNDSGHFECRWINLKIETKSKCVFLPNASNGGRVSFQVAHGEGKFFTDQKTLKKIERQGLVVFRYVDENGKPTQKYPTNPNGALNAIAGITDPTGRILGLMPHPERFVKIEQHPNWRRIKIDKPQGLPIFENMINYIKSKHE